MRIEERERIEWVNYWWEMANTNQVQRWILLGDSVARQFRGSLQEIVGNAIAIDFWGVSFQLDDVRFRRELENFFDSEYSYDMAIITWGCHHGLEREIRCSEDKYKEWYTKYEDNLLFLKTKCKELIIVAATHEVLRSNLQICDDNMNEEIQCRNAVGMELAAKYHLLYVDMYTYMYERKDLYPHIDHVHFIREADRIMAKYITDCLRLTNTEDKPRIQSYGEYINHIGRLENVLSMNKKIILYGTGDIGREIAKYIMKRGKIIHCFVVSDDQTLEYDACDGISIHYFSDAEKSLAESNVFLTTQAVEVQRIMDEKKYCYWKLNQKVVEFVQEYNSVF